MSEINEMSASIRSQLDTLERKISELDQLLGEGTADQAIELDLDSLEMPVLDTADETVEATVDAPEQTHLLEPEECRPVSTVNVQMVDQPKRAVIDAMAEHQAWRHDMPASPVHDIRSAISLNDRLLFINTLFGHDAVLFQNTICALNAMDGFDEAIDYLATNHPGWNLESDTVYRFMMAVRRKLR